MLKNPKNTNSTFNPATFLTISRFFLVPVFVYFFLVEKFTIALIILVIASITDVTDGLLARKFNMGTKIGSILDPLADKFLMLISFLVLSANGILPWWLATIVIGRDFYIVFGLMYLYFFKKLKIEIKPTLLSKRTTFMQFLCLAFSFLKVYLTATPDVLNPQYCQIVFQTHFALVYLTLIFTAATFVQYSYIAIAIIKRGEKREDIII